MSRILLLEDPHELADGVFDKYGIQVERFSGALGENELIDALEGFDMVGIRSNTKVTKRVIEARPQLSAIGAFCIGTNQIDLETASRCGVSVFNAPYSNTRSVVELAIAQIVVLARRMVERTNDLHEGRWNKTAVGSHEIRGRTLGIIGYGNIGAQLSILAEAMGMRVIFFDTSEKLALGNAQRVASLDELLARADVVSLHVDGRPSNDGLFGREQFEKMKHRALFINLSRGFVVDIDALRDHLMDGSIAGAAIDVFPSEPKKPGQPFESPLRGIPNVILTPHIGGSTIEAQADIGPFVAAKLSAYATMGITDLSVNMPNLTMEPTSRSRYRIAYTHRNTPGVLALVNQTFAEHGANIEGQILGTSGEIGYSLTDISSELPHEALQVVKGLQDTIRLKALKIQ